MPAEFMKSATRRREFPPDSGREVAFAGRSNSGKSSAINAILGTRKLARTSKTPGRTQLINFFAVGPAQHEQEQRVVDLPGYGFARVPPEVQRTWQRMLEDYFQSRASLAGVLITVDIRRGLTPLDRDMLGWTLPLGVPVGLLLTKADKLSRGAALAQRRAIAAEAGDEVASLTLFSALKGQGVPEVRDQLQAWLGGVQA